MPRPARWFLLLSLMATVLVPTTGVPAQPATPDPPPDVRELARRLDDLYLSRASISTVELKVVTPRRERTMRMRVWSRGRNRALVVLQRPARERGTATLRIDRNLWNYLPRISRTIRVPPSMMLSSWMGSDFTNDDLVHSASYAEDFSSRIVGRTRSGRGWVLRMRARRGVVGLWRRIDMVVNNAGLPVRAKYFDRRMRHSRTLRFQDVRELDGRRVPTRLVLIPLDRSGHRTELRYLNIDFDARVPSSTFSLSRLERNR